MTTTGARPLAAGAGPGLRPQPLRSVTYRVGGTRRLEDVTMTPPETWNDDLVRRLTAHSTDHVMHLLAPTATLPATLGGWRSAGVLDVAAHADLYGWSWAVAGRQVRGVAGAVALPVRDRLLPHEGVRPDIVAARAAGLSRAAVQAEPIVVLHDGSPLGLAAGPPPGTTPLVDLSTANQRHLVWPLGGPDLVEDLLAVLAAAPTPVVADGHHRLAALDRLGAHPREGRPRITHALVLVVDVGASDLAVRTIHRVLPGLDVDRVAATTGAQLGALAEGRESDYLQAADPAHLRFVLADEHRLLGLDLPLEVVHALRPGPGPGCSPVARDTCHLHSHLLPAWRVPEAELRYIHDWTGARRTASTVGGLAIACAAPGLADVLAAARAGHLLPHKSTSIGPKPRIGLLMFDGRSVGADRLTPGAALP